MPRWGKRAPAGGGRANRFGEAAIVREASRLSSMRRRALDCMRGLICFPDRDCELENSDLVDGDGSHLRRGENGAAAAVLTTTPAQGGGACAASSPTLRQPSHIYKQLAVVRAPAQPHLEAPRRWILSARRRQGSSPGRRIDQDVVWDSSPAAWSRHSSVHCPEPSGAATRPRAPGGAAPCTLSRPSRHSCFSSSASVQASSVDPAIWGKKMVWRDGEESKEKNNDGGAHPVRDGGSIGVTGFSLHCLVCD
jgi:hypothetical protein